MKKKAWILTAAICMAVLTGNPLFSVQAETEAATEVRQDENTEKEKLRPEYPQPEKREIQDGDIVLADNEEMLFLIEGTAKGEDFLSFFPVYLENKSQEDLCVFLTGMQSDNEEMVGLPTPFITVKAGQRYEDQRRGPIRFRSGSTELILNLTAVPLDEYTSYVEKVTPKTWYTLFRDGKFKDGFPFRTIWSDEIILELKDGVLVRREMSQKQEKLAGTFYGQEWLNVLSSDQLDTSGGVYAELEDGVRIWIPDDWYLTAERKEINRTYSEDYKVLESAEETGTSDWQLYNSDFTHMLGIRKLDVKTMLGNLAAAAYVMTEDMLYTELEKKADESRRIKIDGKDALLMTMEGYDDTWDTHIVWMSKNKSVFLFTIYGQEEEWAEAEEILALPREDEEVYLQKLQKVLSSIEIDGIFAAKKPDQSHAKEASDESGSIETAAEDEILSAQNVSVFYTSVEPFGTSSFYGNGQLKETHSGRLFDQSGFDNLVQYDPYGNRILVKTMQIEDGKETVSSHVSWSYEYDEEGNIISFLQTDHVEGSEVSGIYEYEPDETGSAVKRTSLVNGEVREICRTEYDGSGRKIREVSEQADGTIFSDREYVYNEEGKLIQETTYDTEALKNGERKISVVTYYVYDSQGRRKARYSGLRDEGDSMTSQFYVYQSEEP